MNSIEAVQEGAVSGFLHRPLQGTGEGIVLTHGAGSNANSPLLRALAEAFTGSGFVVLRCDLPYRQKRPTGPPVPAMAAQDREGLRDAVQWLRRIVPGAVVLGGHSYGGRQSSILAAEDPSVAEALLLLSYPLHPPKKREQMRTAHFPALRTPSLFVHGTRDPFGLPEEMRAALPAITARWELLEIEGAGHELTRGRIDYAVIVERSRSLLL